MRTQTQFNTILSKKLSRKDFIKQIGLGIVALSGAGLALRLLSGNLATSTNEGYGGSAYGGGSGGPR